MSVKTQAKQPVRQYNCPVQAALDVIGRLERDDIVRRKIYPEIPPKVEYSLTDFGDPLRPLIVMLNEWGQMHLKRIAQR